MAEANGQEKTEQATPKRRKDARKEGNVFQSKDVATVVTLFGMFTMLQWMIPAIHENVADKNVTRKMQYAVSNNSNDYDTFNEHLDEYLADPEDEITYPPEIYDALIDDE